MLKVMTKCLKLVSRYPHPKGEREKGDRKCMVKGWGVRVSVDLDRLTLKNRKKNGMLGKITGVTCLRAEGHRGATSITKIGQVLTNWKTRRVTRVPMAPKKENLFNPLKQLQPRGLPDLPEKFTHNPKTQKELITKMTFEVVETSPFPASWSHRGRGRKEG